jgi:hypothetical protein
MEVEYSFHAKIFKSNPQGLCLLYYTSRIWYVKDSGLQGLGWRHGCMDSGVRGGSRFMDYWIKKFDGFIRSRNLVDSVDQDIWLIKRFGD